MMNKREWEQLEKDFGKFQMQEKCKVCFHYFIKYERCLRGDCIYSNKSSLLEREYPEDYAERVRRGWISEDGKPVQLENEELRCEI